VLTERPRMADFARVFAAVDQVTGWHTLDGYRATARDAVSDVLDGEPFAQAVVALVDESGPDGIVLTASELLERVHTPERIPKRWPKDATRASGQLKRLAPALRTIGIEVDDSRRGPKPKKQRLLALTATPDRLASIQERRSNAASPASPDGEKRPLTSANTGDATASPAASPRCAPGHGGTLQTLGVTLANAVASPKHLAPDQRKHRRGDAGDAGDADMHPLSDAVTPHAWWLGRRTGAHGRDCPECRRAIGGPDHVETV
jgi:hypothetical protein